MKSFKRVFPVLTTVLAVIGIIFIVLFIIGYKDLKKNEAAASEPKSILFCNTKIGETRDNRISINFEDTTYSFEADTKAPDLFSSDNLTLYGGCAANGRIPSDWNERITYKHLIIHLPSKNRLIKMTYVCDAPFAGRLYLNCEANGQDKINEYEFGNGYTDKISGLADNYDSTYRWEKIMIRKINNKDMIFEGLMLSPSARSSVFGTGKCTDNQKYICETEKEKSYSSYIDPRSLFTLYLSLRQFNLTPDMHIYENTVTYSDDEQWYKDLLSTKDIMLRRIQSDEYLLNLLGEKDNLTFEKDWTGIIDSFKIETSIK